MPGGLGSPVGEPLTRAFLDSGEAATTLRTASPLGGSERLYAMHRVGHGGRPGEGTL